MNPFKRFFNWFLKRHIVAKILIGVVAIFLSCCLCSVPIAILSPSTPTSVPTTTSMPQASVSSDGVAVTALPSNTPTSAPTNTPVPTSTPMPTDTPNPNFVGVGIHIVNQDIQPGIYKGQAGTDFFSSCYWERLKDLTGELDSIIANDNAIGQFYIEIKPTDYALKTDCELLRLESIPEHTGEYPQVISPGTYLVGSDIRPGTYKGQAGSDVTESCYWARLRNVTGELEGIIANDNATGQFYVQVLPTDFALTTECELEWVSP